MRITGWHLKRCYGWNWWQFQRLAGGAWTLYFAKLMLTNWEGDGGMLGGAEVYAEGEECL